MVWTGGGEAVARGDATKKTKKERGSEIERQRVRKGRSKERTNETGCEKGGGGKCERGS